MQNTAIKSEWYAESIWDAETVRGNTIRNNRLQPLLLGRNSCVGQSAALSNFKKPFTSDSSLFDQRTPYHAFKQASVSQRSIESSHQQPVRQSENKLNNKQDKPTDCPSMTRNMLLIGFGQNIPLPDLCKALQTNGDLRRIIRANDSVIVMFNHLSNALRFFQCVATLNVIPLSHVVFLTAFQIIELVDSRVLSDINPSLCNQGVVEVAGAIPPSAVADCLPAVKRFLGSFGTVLSVTNFEASATLFRCVVEYDNVVHADLLLKQTLLFENNTLSVKFFNGDAITNECLKKRFSQHSFLDSLDLTLMKQDSATFAQREPFVPFSETRESHNDCSNSLYSESPLQVLNRPSSYASSVSGSRRGSHLSSSDESAGVVPSECGFTTPPAEDATEFGANDGQHLFKTARRIPAKYLMGISLDAIAQGNERRTTFMIRNIPNKYTQAMLIEHLNELQKGQFDFLYLRMDFKNDCNVGYAFINFRTKQSILDFVSQMVGRTWPRFKSDKVCALSFAAIQGKEALVDKFRNSSVMLEYDDYRPKVFDEDGDEIVFPGPTHSGYRPKVDVLFSRVSKSGVKK